MRNSFSILFLLKIFVSLIVISFISCNRAGKKEILKEETILVQNIIMDKQEKLFFSYNLIANILHLKELIDYNTVYFSDNYNHDLRQYYGGSIFHTSNYFIRFFDNIETNIILLTKQENDKEIVIDFILIEKMNSESYLYMSANNVMIDNIYPDYDVIVLFASHWQGRSSQNIERLYYINLNNYRIEEIFFDAAIVFSEL
ncbi:MAG: hypothetical protein FWH12_08480 [Treponema sp.]|nr:hypothetical protein [Treponema sp.]